LFPRIKKSKKKDWRTLEEEWTDMRSLFYDIHRTVMKAVERSGYSISMILSMLGISRSWYYSLMDFSPILDGRFNPLAVRDDDEWIVIGFRNEHPAMSFREYGILTIIGINHSKEQVKNLEYPMIHGFQVF